MKIEMEVFLHLDADNDYALWDRDMESVGSLLLLTATNVTFEIDESVFKDAKVKLAEKLGIKLGELRAKHQHEIISMENKINSLLALEHKQ